MTPKQVTISLDLEEATLLLDWTVRAIGKKRTKPGSSEYRAHEKVWEAWSELSKDSTKD